MTSRWALEQQVKDAQARAAQTEHKQFVMQAKSELESKALSRLGIILPTVIGLFGILMTVIVIYFSLNTKESAVAAAKAGIEDIRGELEKRLKEAETLLTKIQDYEKIAGDIKDDMLRIDVPQNNQTALNLSALPPKSRQEVKKSLGETVQDPQSKRATRPTTSAQMTMSEIDSIRSQIEQCWIVPAGVRYAENFVVRVRIFLRPDGGLAQPPQVVDTLRMSMPGEEAYRTVAESAVRAIMKCEPFQNLPVDKYDRWQDIELSFDPRSILGG